MNFTKGQTIKFAHEWEDYNIKAGKEYEVKSNLGRLYIDVAHGDSVYFDNGEFRPEVLADIISCK